MIESYRELTLDKYLEIMDILKGGDDDLQKQAQIISVLSGEDVNTVLGYTLDKYRGMVEKMSFLYKKPEVTSRIAKKMVINGKDYEVCTKVDKLTTAQYIDYQTYSTKPDQERYIAAVLSCFIVPAGHKYCEGYDVAEVISDLEQHLSIQDAMNVCFFFRKKSLDSIRDSLTYLDLMIKMMKRREKNPKTKEKLKELTLLMKQYRDLVNSGDGLLW